MALLAVTGVWVGLGLRAAAPTIQSHADAAQSALHTVQDDLTAGDYVGARGLDAAQLPSTSFVWSQIAVNFGRFGMNSTEIAVRTDVGVKVSARGPPPPLRV